MSKAGTHIAACVCLLLGLFTGVLCAQQTSAEDEVIDAIRTRTDIGDGDQRRIGGWVEREIAKFSDLKASRARFNEQYNHAGNSQPFRSQFATQTARVAAQQFVSADLNSEVAFALARVLVDMNAAETFEGLIAGLKSTDVRARFVCAKGLVAQKSAIAAGKGTLDRAVEALGAAGLAEPSPVVLARIYDALALPGQVSVVFDTYVNLFDKRLQSRRGSAIKANAGEIPAWEFFRTTGVVSALSAEQKSRLATRLGVFLRLDAELYRADELDFYERDKLERLLDGEETILAELVGPGKGGAIRAALSTGAHEKRREVLREAYRWVGNPETKGRGALNDAPWNLPVGAP